MILKIDSSVLELKGEIRSWSLFVFKGLNKNDVQIALMIAKLNST